MESPNQERILKDIRHAVRVFACFEETFGRIDGPGLAYLREWSGRYKATLRQLQEMVGPAVAAVCPKCTEPCCQLSAPTQRIYLALSLGGFQLVDYLLVRCDTVLPRPALENAQRNHCPFLGQGCVLPADSRSYCCTQWFCADLAKRLDMSRIRILVEQLREIVSTFSVSRCLSLSAPLPTGSPFKLEA